SLRRVGNRGRRTGSAAHRASTRRANLTSEQRAKRPRTDDARVTTVGQDERFSFRNAAANDRPRSSQTRPVTAPKMITTLRAIRYVISAKIVPIGPYSLYWEMTMLEKKTEKTATMPT